VLDLDFSFLEYSGDEFVDGFLTTFQVSVVALVLALALGTVIAVLRISGVKPLEAFGTAYVEFIRNTPLVIQIFFGWGRWDCPFIPAHSSPR
jgi:putative glutamine transport system permease protein